MFASMMALTLNGFREARRNRVTVVVVAFAIALLLFAALLTNFALSTFDRVLTDLGLGAMSIMLVLLAIYLSSGMLPREIERRTLFLIVSKPISRGTFLLGRFAGNLLTLLVLQTLMAVVFLVSVKIWGTHVTEAQVVAIAMLYFELLMLSAIGVLMSSFTGQLVAGTVTVAMYFAGHLSRDIYEMGQKAGGGLKWIAESVYYALPNLERVNFRPQATYEVSTAFHDLLGPAAYAIGYSGILLAVAVILFNRRDFK